MRGLQQGQGPDPDVDHDGHVPSFRDELSKRLAVAETIADDEDQVLTTIERQALWAARDLRSVPSMVWMPAHAGEFADYLERTGERLAALFIVAMYTGMRRDEILGLTWSEVDLDQSAAFVRETAGVDTKIISTIPGHARSDFTDRQYVSVFPEVTAAAAAAADALIPRAAHEGGAK